MYLSFTLNGKDFFFSLSHAWISSLDCTKIILLKGGSCFTIRCKEKSDKEVQQLQYWVLPELLGLYLWVLNCYQRKEVNRLMDGVVCWGKQNVLTLILWKIEKQIDFPISKNMWIDILAYASSRFDEIFLKILVLSWTKGALPGNIYGLFNYISQTEFQLEKRCTACVKSLAINLWLRIMVNNLTLHNSIIWTLLFLGIYFLFPRRTNCS